MCRVDRTVPSKINNRQGIRSRGGGALELCEQLLHGGSIRIEVGRAPDEREASMLQRRRNQLGVLPRAAKTFSAAIVVIADHQGEMG